MAIDLTPGPVHCTVSVPAPALQSGPIDIVSTTTRVHCHVQPVTLQDAPDGVVALIGDNPKNIRYELTMQTPGFATVKVPFVALTLDVTGILREAPIIRQLPVASAAKPSLGGILRTLDGGSSWSQKNTDAAQSLSVLDVAWAPSNTSILYAVLSGVLLGQGSVLKSLDGGHTWVLLPGPELAPTADPNHLIAIDPSDPDIVYVATSGGLKKTSDGGASWSFATLGMNRGGVLFPGSACTGVLVSNQDANIVYASHFSIGVQRSLNKGATWEDFGGLAPGVTLNVRHMEQAGNGDLYLSRDIGSLWKIPYGSSTMAAVGTWPGDPRDVQALAPDTQDTDGIYASYMDVVGDWFLAHSTDAGATWSEFDETDGFTACRFITVTASGDVYTGNSDTGGILAILGGVAYAYKKLAAGSTFSALTAFIPARLFTNLRAHPSDNGTLIGTSQRSGGVSAGTFWADFEVGKKRDVLRGAKGSIEVSEKSLIDAGVDLGARIDSGEDTTLIVKQVVTLRSGIRQHGTLGRSVLERLEHIENAGHRAVTLYCNRITFETYRQDQAALVIDRQDVLGAFDDSGSPELAMLIQPNLRPYMRITWDGQDYFIRGIKYSLSSTRRQMTLTTRIFTVGDDSVPRFSGRWMTAVSLANIGQGRI